MPLPQLLTDAEARLAIDALRTQADELRSTATESERDGRGRDAMHMRLRATSMNMVADKLLALVSP